MVSYCTARLWLRKTVSNNFTRVPFSRLSAIPVTNPLETPPGPAERPDRSGCAGSQRPRRGTWQLLVSVRSAEEARTALCSSVDVVDLKEPRRGALAPVETRLWQQVAELRQRLSPGEPVEGTPAGTSRGVPLSAALGERAEAVSVAAAVPSSFAFAKAGPSGCRTRGELLSLWQQIRRQLPGATELVAVAYADHRQAGCLPPESILQAAAEFGIRRALIDTFTKDGRSTLDHLGTPRLRDLSQLAVSCRLWWVLAGSLRLDMLSRCAAAGIAPDCVGVRGDVCRHDRTGRLDVERIRLWQEEIRALP